MLGEKFENTICIRYSWFNFSFENVKGYLHQEDVDGALVGGASLKIDSFTAMVKNLAE